jgi:hypothetical protein
MDADLVSGSVISEAFSLTILDENLNLINTDNSSTATLEALNPDQVALYKSKTVKAKNGLLTFDDVVVVALPGSTIYLRVNPDSILKNRIQAAFPSLSLVPDIYIKGYMRLC